MDKIKQALAGKKTYITAAIGVLGAIVAWSGGEASLAEAGAMVWAAISAAFIRSGVTSEVKKAVQ